jgi:hypothetical protein
MKLKFFNSPAQQLAWLERTERGGFWRFLILRGILMQGLITDALVTVFNLAIGHPVHIAETIRIGLFVSIFYSVFMWFSILWLHSRAQERKRD